MKSNEINRVQTGIVGDLRTRINQIAHSAGQRHALATKARLMTDLQRLAAAGANRAALSDHLDQTERAL